MVTMNSTQIGLNWTILFKCLEMTFVVIWRQDKKCNQTKSVKSSTVFSSALPLVTVYVMTLLFSGYLLWFQVFYHVFRLLVMFVFPCHIVHSSHLFSVLQLHLITNHLPTVFSFLVSLTHCKILTNLS